MKAKRHHLQPLGLAELSRAWTRVWHELENIGLASPRLACCQVYLGVISRAYGYQWLGDRSGGRTCGDIVLPRVSLAHMFDYLNGRSMESTLDILRHEYGHAFADVNERRVESSLFSKAFGDIHSLEAVPLDYDPDHHVTGYAATSTAEDFAEVFYLFLKHKGKLPNRLNTRPIKRKWQFVASCCKP